MYRILKDIIVEKKGLKFFKDLINKIGKINQNGGYAYITGDTIRLQSTPSLLSNHRFEFNLKDRCSVNYYSGGDSLKIITHDEFIKILEELCKMF